MLLLSRRFAPLFWCQFLSAFNDNFLKTVLVFIILFRIGGSAAESLITLASAIFIAPYFFLSALGGELADRYDKARVAQRLKLAEIAVAGIAVLGFVLSSVVMLYVALFGFGVIAALFGPLKYGILPDHLERSELPSGNALVEGATFAAILGGTIAGGIAAKDGGNVVVISALVMGFAVACWLTSRFIPATGEAAPQLAISRNIAASTVALLRHLRSDTKLWWGALVTSWFWVAGILLLSLLPPLVKMWLGGNEDTVTAYLALFTVAVASGSAAAAIIARGQIRLMPALAGVALLAVFALDLAWALSVRAPVTASNGPHDIMTAGLGLRVAIDLFGMAAAGGLFVVPAFAAVQAWSGVERRARTVAAVNVLNAAGMTGVTVIVAILQALGVSMPMLFAGIGAVSLLIALTMARTMPRG